MATVRTETALIGFETIYLDWVRNITIFLTAAIALLAFLQTHDIAYWLVMLSIFLLIVAQVDFFSQRQNLATQGVDIPLRIDFLWVGSTAFLLILIWVLWKMGNSDVWKRQFSSVYKDPT